MRIQLFEANFQWSILRLRVVRDVNVAGVDVPANTMQACNISAIVEDLLPWEKKNLDHTHIDRDLGGWAAKPR